MSSDAVSAPTQPTFAFERDELVALGRKHAAHYRDGDPFPHIVLDDFLPTDVLRGVLAEFPDPDDLLWRQFDSNHELKLATEDPETIPPYARHVLSQFNSAAMVEFLEALTGMEGIIPDPHYWGGGLHQIERGGRLDVHTDFNWHKRLLLDRRINVLLYLNEGWRPEWGGALELWNRDMSECGQRILPIANRLVVFNTTDYSYHGHPEPLACPAGRTRRSLALYYYTNGRPDFEVSPLRSTRFTPRPGEVWLRGKPTNSLTARAVDAVRRRWYR
jgi:hypothetical protein